MSLDSDVALLGTGLAPLVAAHHLQQRGFSVLLLNPDNDYFLEDSELPFDPLWSMDESSARRMDRILRGTPENVLAELQPSFPGTVETWSEGADQVGFRDPEAPHLRQRGHLWVASPGEEPGRWEALEEFYVECLDRGLNPQLLEGLQALSKFPGFSGRALDYRGVWLPKFCDADVVRYRNGVLEFVRERQGEKKVICGATQVEMIPEGLRFNASRGSLEARTVPKTARIRLGVLAFWTPRLIQWVLAQSRKFASRPVQPRGVRVIEQWALVSRDQLDPKAVGVLGDMVVWAQTSGAPPALSTEPDTGLFRLAVLRQGPLLSLESWVSHEHGASWASSQSFDSLKRLCLDLLGWDRFSIRSMRPRAILEWDGTLPWRVGGSNVPLYVLSGCDGPLVDVVRAARHASELLGDEESQ